MKTVAGEPVSAGISGGSDIQIQEDTESPGQRQESGPCDSLRQVVKLSPKSGSGDGQMMVPVDFPSLFSLGSQPMGW